MGITIDIPDAVLEYVRSAAIARGQDINTFAVAAMVAIADETKTPDEEPLSWREFARAMAEGVPVRSKPLSDYAVSHAGIYGEHP